MRLSICMCVATAGLFAAPVGGAIGIETYTDRAAFEARLGATSLVDFDDVDTATSDPTAFAADRYKASEGIVITGASGQYAGTPSGFVFPGDYPALSSPNVYAPGPVSTPSGGGNQTEVTFFVDGDPGFVAGFGAVFIDADFPNAGPSSLSVFDDQGDQLGTSGTINGSDASQLFFGIVAVDTDTNLPVPAIASAVLINGNGWPGGSNNEGVVLDDFVFGNVVPEPMSAALLGFAGLALLRRRC